MHKILNLIILVLCVYNANSQLKLPTNLPQNQKFELIRNHVLENNLPFSIKNNEVLKFNLDQITGILLDDNVNFINENPTVRINSNTNYIRGINPNSRRFDPRNLPNFPTVKNQLQCGSCWAFCATDNFTISNFYKNNVAIDLSEQQVLSCSNAGTCNGGSTSPVYSWMVRDNTELVAEEEMPYRHLDLSCPIFSDFQDYEPINWGVIGSTWSEIPSLSEIKSSIAQYGAVSSYVAVTSLFQSYGSGVFRENSTAQINHCVTIVGWDDNLNAWLVKNSWGSNWGREGGYMWIDYNSNKIGTNATWIESKQVRPRKKDCPFSDEITGSNFVIESVKYPKKVLDASAGTINRLQLWELYGQNQSGNCYIDNCRNQKWNIKQHATATEGCLFELYSSFQGKQENNSTSKSVTKTRTNKAVTKNKRFASIKPIQLLKLNKISNGIYSIEIPNKKQFLNPNRDFYSSNSNTRKLGNSRELNWGKKSIYDLKKSQWKIYKAPNIPERKLDGTWRNKDKNTRDITRVKISNKNSKIQTFGKCHPSDCDWGTVSLRKSGSNFKAKYDTRVGITDMKLELLNERNLKLSYMTDYHDSRATRRTTLYFTK